MSRFVVRQGEVNKKISSSPDTKTRGSSPGPETKNWSTENAVFVAAYNELIDAEGVALEEYRLF